MKRIVIVKEGKKLYGKPYMDNNQEKLYQYTDTTKKDYEEFSKVLKQNCVKENEYEMWYVEEVE